MAFIDIFNFKKYFATPSDSQVARYGHLNALAKRITDPVFATQDAEEDVTANGYVGKISLSTISTETTKIVSISNSFATANSVLLISMGASTAIDFPVTLVGTASTGSIAVTITNYSTDYDIEDPILNFLIIN